MPKAAAIQMCSSASVDENLDAALQLIMEAANNQAELIVLPEMFPVITMDKPDKLKWKENYGAGKIQAFLAETAKKFGVWIVGGTIPISSGQENKMRAACLVYNDQGKVVARYDKIHMFDVTISEHEFYRESDSIEAGDQAIVVDTPIGKLGLAVCYDIRFPYLFTHLANLGAEIFSVPAAFTVKTGSAHWHLLTRCRAVENFCYLIGACQGGTHANGRQTYGHSLIIEPWGSVLAELMQPFPGTIYADIDLKHLMEIRNAIPVREHQKIIS